jgi:hypothetical protein
MPDTQRSLSATTSAAITTTIANEIQLAALTPVAVDQVLSATTIDSVFNRRDDFIPIASAATYTAPRPLEKLAAKVGFNRP